ncbi:MAG TPA: hypothetical protein PKY05_16605, partial [Fibrobacteria bacterium]|nr:hypothetical protein [Fibrobacteria bacterium]
MPSSPTSRRVWRIVRLLAILAFVVGAWFFVDMLESRRLRFDGSIGTLRSPGGVWWLDLRKTDPWTYGPHGIHVVIVPTEPGLFGIDRMPFDALAFDLRNDGASLGPDNLIARWEGDSVLHVF